jgi:hypothetical protein
VAAGLYGFAAAALWGSSRPPLAEAALLQAGTSLLAFGLTTWVFGLRVARLTPRELRWRPGGGHGFFVGLALGTAPAVPQVVLGNAFGRGTAIVALSAVFALAHGLNPGITPLAAGNIALAGVFLGVTFYLPGGLWTATGAHLGWNATLAALGAPVSGLPFAMPMLDYRSGGPEWLTGGGFGPEGGVLGTAALAGATLMVVRLIRRGASG